MSSSVPSGPAETSLAEQAYRTLEQKLVSLELPPGTMVSEGRLIAMTGLGRTPVREAMQRLAQQDLIRVLPRKGLLVTPVSQSAMAHILEVRKPLERVIVYRAALNAKDEQRGGLAAIARELAIAHDNFEAFLRLENEINRLFDDCAGNPFASAAVAPLRSHCRRFWYLHRQRLQLSDAISAQSNLARLAARRDFNGAQKAVDGVIAVFERLAAGVDRLG
ncbi:MAG: GntR family transcriptional regulator [Xanthomonadales bacterium]|jgi:DNA-binding GntR family transcriptional regulator|nr:GntR family transcriptional regulator [Xanthomonadales bacterium]